MEAQIQVNESTSLEHCMEESTNPLNDHFERADHLKCRKGEELFDLETFDDPLMVKNFKKRKPNKSKVEPSRKKIKVNQSLELDNEADEQVESDAHTVAETTARRYQLEVLEKAILRNTIVYLETGCGKTLIAVLLIKSLAQRLRMPGNKRVAIFLAPTVHLVHQQAEVISIHTDLKVGNYFGEKGVDTWTPQVWASELDEHEVLVMTPQVLLDALGTSSLRLDLVELLIMDECHHAQKKHPYAQIMSTHYYNLPLEKRPKVFGMTASPVIRKGVTSSMDCNNQIKKLEAILDAQVCTVEDRSEVEKFVPTPNQQSRYYRKYTGIWDSVRESLEHLKDKLVNSALMCDSMTEAGPLCDEMEVNVRKTIGRLHNSLDYCLMELGLLPTLQAAEMYLRDDKDLIIDDAFEDAMKSPDLKTQFLREALEILQLARLQGPAGCCNSETEIRTAVKTGLISPKVHLLVNELLRYRNVDDVRCIVFVERVIASMVLANLPSWFSELSFLQCDHMTGVNAEHRVKSQKQQQQTVGLFRSGKVNLLVATSVAEEGVDVQSCNSVIRFDLPKTVCSYIQSRGRARRPGSDYIFFLERGNKLHEALIFEVIKSEVSMKKQSCSRGDMSLEEKQMNLGTVEIFKVESTGALVSIDTSVNLIYRYCSKLPGDKFYRPAPDFSYSELTEEKSYVCTLRFPPNASLQVVAGEGRPNRQLAKQAACFEACKQLYFCGALTENLIPVKDLEEEEEEKMNKAKKNWSGAGTTARKELHPSIDTRAFFGEWRSAAGGVSLQAYRLSFCFQPCQEQDYADFVLLLNEVLDEDVGNLEIQLHLTLGRMCTAQISAWGRIDLDEIQLRDSKKYHEVLYNGMFSKLILCAKGAKESSEAQYFIIEEEKLWSPSKMYLLLPLLPSADSRGKSVDEAIDWKGISATAAAAQFISMKEVLPKEPFGASSEALNCASSKTPKDKSILQTAAGVVPVSSISDTVVLTVHTGKVYCVVDVLHDRNATHSFPGEESSEAPKFSSYSDYFLNKYKRVLRFPYQPLLQVKQTHRVHNLLAGKLKEKEDNLKLSGAQGLVELPPELCLDLGLKSPVVRALYLVPSVLHRWVAIINAAQLRHQIIDSYPSCPFVPSNQIMQALTTLRCREDFSFEGFELLGDSFLKYAVSRRLYLVYKDKHEGQLSARRSRAVSNATLHRLALKRGLPKFIRDEAFDPSHWLLPGMYCKKDVVCRCNTSNLLGSEEEENADGKVITDRVVRIGKTCAKGHRWLCSKTIADAVEALIGAYFVEGGDAAAMTFMRWIGIDIDFEPSLIAAACTSQFVPSDMAESFSSCLEGLEKQLGYSFKNKGLLLEAITHASEQQSRGGMCYQRLEFLGDSVLDLLITRHLFNSHPGLSPGCLTDLRSAAVNNDCFAQVAVKYSLQKFLRHGSALLLGKITEFVRCIGNTKEDLMKFSFGWEEIECPKVLGDIVESIAAAVLVDSGFDVELVWTIMKPLLSPIVTPETLPLHPVRELQELCHLKGLSLQWRKVPLKEKATIVELSIDVGETKLVKKSNMAQKKVARKYLAKRMLASLQGLGLHHPQKATQLQSLHNQDVQCSASLSHTTTPRSDRVSSEPNIVHIEDNSPKNLPTKTDFKRTCEDKEAESAQALNQSDNDVVNLPVDIDPAMPLDVQPSETSIREDQRVESLLLNEGSLAMSSTVPVEEVERDTVMQTSISGSTGSIFSKGRPLLIEEENSEVQMLQNETDGENATLESTQADIKSSFGDFKYLPPPLLSLNTEAMSSVKSGVTFKKQEEENDFHGRGDFRHLPAFLLEIQKLVVKDKQGEPYSSFDRKEQSYQKPNPGECASNSSSANDQTLCSSISEASLPKEKPVAENHLPDVATIYLQKFRSHATLSTRIKAGTGRSSLYELCSKRKWKDPQFVLSREEGLPHEKRFTFSVKVEVKDIGAQEVEGSMMPDKRKAMDSAAVNMILHLTSLGLTS